MSAEVAQLKYPQYGVFEIVYPSDAETLLKTFYSKDDAINCAILLIENQLPGHDYCVYELQEEQDVE